MKTALAPGMSVMRLAMRPPVQLSAAAKVIPFSFSSRRHTASRLGSSTA